MTTASLPVFEFLQGHSEDFVVAYKMNYAGAPTFFTEGAEYKLALATLEGDDAIAFSSEHSSTNLIQVSAVADTPVSGVCQITFTFKAPWRSFYMKAGSRAGNLQIKNSSGIHDLAIVSGKVQKRPTTSEPLPQ